MIKLTNTIYKCISFIVFSFTSLSILALSNKPQDPVVLIVGTRPEAIKMIPVYKALKDEKIPTYLCSTGQHKQILEDIFDLFKVKPDFDFEIMKENQDLFDITEKILIKAKDLFQKLKPSLVVVQGDTTSAMAAALAAFYLKISVAHIEAGLRTYNMQNPFPEEMNRRFITLVSSYHFAPTNLTVSNLFKEGIDKNSIFLTGNTGIDSLLTINAQIKNKQIFPSKEIIDIINKCKSNNNKLLLLTVHRRETITDDLKNIYLAMKEALKKHPNLTIIYPLHPNPIIQKTLKEAKLEFLSNIKITSPLSYQDMAHLLNNVDFVFTDSGGIQEEAMGLNKPVFVLRNDTARQEGMKVNMCELIGTNSDKMMSKIDQICFNNKKIEHSAISNPIYGDGRAAKKIALVIKEILNKKR